VVTAEFAVALPAVVIMLATLLTTVTVALDQMRCTDAARAAVRAAARNETTAAVVGVARAVGPDGAQVQVGRSGDRAVVRVMADVRIRLLGNHSIHVESQAVAVREESGELAAGLVAVPWLRRRRTKDRVTAESRRRGAPEHYVRLGGCRPGHTPSYRWQAPGRTREHRRRPPVSGAGIRRRAPARIPSWRWRPLDCGAGIHWRPAARTTDSGWRPPVSGAGIRRRPAARATDRSWRPPVSGAEIRRRPAARTADSGWRPSDRGAEPRWTPTRRTTDRRWRASENGAARRRRHDRGAGTVLAVGLLSAAAILALGLSTVGQVIVARHRASAAADLAALAAARTANASSAATAAAEPCPVAREVAAANGARLTSCVLDASGVVSVSAQTDTNAALGVFRATAKARAGPADTSKCHGELRKVVCVTH
jgi:secretion/DNA translocation related TadE-like protein